MYLLSTAIAFDVIDEFKLKRDLIKFIVLIIFDVSWFLLATYLFRISDASTKKASSWFHLEASLINAMIYKTIFLYLFDLNW